MKFLEDKPLYFQYLEGELSEIEQARLLAQLGQEEKRELMAVRSALLYLDDLPQIESPAGLVQVVMAAIQPAKVPEPEKESLISKVRAWFDLRPLLGWQAAGMAVAASVTLMVSLSVLQQPAEENPMVPGLSPAAMTASTAQGRLVKFRLYAPSASQVTVVGDFNEWGSGSESRLMKKDDGEWVANVPLSPGNYQYAFVVDGKIWVTDPQAVQHVQDDFGRKNAVLYVM